MSSDVEEEVGGEEEEVIAAPDDTYADDDFDGAAGNTLADDEPAQAETSYAADDGYKEDAESELEPEPSRKAATGLDEEPSYQDDFDQSMVPGVSKLPEEDEDRNSTSAAIDEQVDDSTPVGAPGAAGLAKSSSGAGKTSSAGPESRQDNGAVVAAPKALPAAKPAAAPKPAAASATKPAASAPAKPLPVSLKPAVSKPAAPGPKPAVAAAPKPAAPRAAAPAPPPKPAATKPAPPAVVVAKPSVAARNMAPMAPSPVQPSATGFGSGGHKVKLTFTGPPNTQRAAPTVKPDYSHSKYEVGKINSDNMKLCNRLVEISRAPPNPAYNNALSVGSAAVTGKLAPANVAAATVNRHRKEDKIAQENLALYKRLQSVKPSPSVNRDVLSKEYVKTQAYGENARKVRSPPAQHNTTTSGTAGTTAAKAAASGATRQPAPGSAEEVYSRPSGSGSVGEGYRGVLERGVSDGGDAIAPDLSTVMEGPEGEASDGTYTAAQAPAVGDLEPEYSMDPEFDQAPSQSFAT